MEIPNKELSGIYLAYKKWELVWLENKLLNQKNSFNYFVFEKLIHKSFPHDMCEKILEHINCGDRKVALDFDKKEAKVILQKDEPFENVLKPYFDPKFIANTIENPEEYIDLYSNSKLDIKKL